MLSLAGTSLGGIHAVIGAAMGGDIDRHPNRGGGGLADVMTRSGHIYSRAAVRTDPGKSGCRMLY